MSDKSKKRGGGGRGALGVLRTGVKLVLLVLSYFWFGAAYKLVYAQTHDLSRFRGRLPISYYQQQFLIDSLLHQTWVFGPAFQAYIGEMPSLAGLLGGNPQAALADYCRRREQTLAALPTTYPRSLFVDEALDDAFFYSQAASVLGIFGATEKPDRVMSTIGPGGNWLTMSIPDFSGSGVLAERLADEYPDSPHAAAALLKVAEAQSRGSDPSQAEDTYRRLSREYPESDEGEAAAEALYSAATAAGDVEKARRYKRRALTAAERTARERYAGQALPAANTMTILGYRIDLSRVELALTHVPAAKDLLAVAGEEATRLAKLTALDDGMRDRLHDRRERMERLRSELWVADLFDALKVGVPGPPPRPQEHDVRGRVLVDGQPMAGIRVVLIDTRRGGGGQGGGRGRAPMRRAVRQSLGIEQAPRYRTETDDQGRYALKAVEGGTYDLAVVYPVAPPELGGAPLVPAKSPDLRSTRLTVSDGDVTEPVLRLRRGVRTRTFTEAPLEGSGVRLEWDPWPGAASYRVEVLCSTGFQGPFSSRAEHDPGFWLRPVLWRRTGKETHAGCPLTALQPDNSNNPFAARAVQYEYVVTALDSAGRELATSAAPLARFHLSKEGRLAMMQLRPRRGGGGFGGLRRRRPEGPGGAGAPGGSGAGGRGRSGQ